MRTLTKSCALLHKSLQGLTLSSIQTMLRQIHRLREVQLVQLLEGAGQLSTANQLYRSGAIQDM